MLIDWLQKPSTIVWGLYLAAAELASCLPSYSFSCILVSDENNAKGYSGNQSCAAVQEAIFRFLRFIWVNANHDNINAFAAIAVAVFTFTLWRSTVKLWETGEKQIAVAESANSLNREISVASRRAWISIEDVKLIHPTKFMEDGIVFRVQVVTKNLGQTPATSVWIDFESYFSENISEKFTDAERRFKDKLRAHPVELGELLFPGDTNTYWQGWADGIEKIKDAIGTRPSGEKRIGFTVFIGLSYRIVGDSSAI